MRERRFHTGVVELNYAEGPAAGPALVLLRVRIHSSCFRSRHATMMAVWQRRRCAFPNTCSRNCANAAGKRADRSIPSPSKRCGGGWGWRRHGTMLWQFSETWWRDLPLQNSILRRSSDAWRASDARPEISLRRSIGRGKTASSHLPRFQRARQAHFRGRRSLHSAASVAGRSHFL
jgi:hypothetical protein